MPPMSPYITRSENSVNTGDSLSHTCCCSLVFHLYPLSSHTRVCVHLDMLHLSAFVWRISLHVHAVPVEATEGVRSETEGRLGAAVQGLGIEPGLLEEQPML